MTITIGQASIEKGVDVYGQDGDGVKTMRLTIPVKFEYADSGFEATGDTVDRKSIDAWFKAPASKELKIQLPKGETFAVNFFTATSKRKTPDLALSACTLGVISIGRKNNAPLAGSFNISAYADAEAASAYLMQAKGFVGRIEIIAEQKAIGE